MLNLTPHEICIVDEEGALVEAFPASGTVARMSTSEKEVGLVRMDGCPVTVVSTTMGEIVGLPKFEDLEGHEQLLVSSMVLDQLGPEWFMIAFAPDTGATAVRNEKNHIVGVTRLRTVAK